MAQRIPLMDLSDTGRMHGEALFKTHGLFIFYFDSDGTLEWQGNTRRIEFLHSDPWIIPVGLSDLDDAWHRGIGQCIHDTGPDSPRSKVTAKCTEHSHPVGFRRTISYPLQGGDIPSSQRPHAASNVSPASTEKPGRLGEPACSPGRNTPCSLYSPPDGTSPVRVPATGLAIQDSGMPASA